MDGALHHVPVKPAQIYRKTHHHGGAAPLWGAPRRSLYVLLSICAVWTYIKKLYTPALLFFLNPNPVVVYIHGVPSGLRNCSLSNGFAGCEYCLLRSSHLLQQTRPNKCAIRCAKRINRHCPKTLQSGLSKSATHMGQNKVRHKCDMCVPKVCHEQ